jgi:hypothetical protein
MGISKPFNSENEEINQLINWVIRNFRSKEDVPGATLREMTVGQTKIRDAEQKEGEIRFRRHQDSDGKFLQPILKHENISYPMLAVQANQHIDLGIKYVFSSYDAEPARGSVTNLHGGLLALATAQALGPATPANDITVTKGIGKILIVLNAGSDFAGTITITGDTIDRNTGVKTVGDTDTITTDALTTDNSDTDSNGNARYSFTGAYITSKWFTGSVTLSTANLTLTDVDTYHVSFEQFGDTSHVRLDTFDANIFTTNVAAEFDAYLYSLVVAGSKCDITREASLNVGADGETAIANKYWRLRRGYIEKIMNGQKDGIWADVFYSNSPAYIEDVNVKIWVSKMQEMEDKEV